MPSRAQKAKVNRPVAVITPELDEFIDELVRLPLGHAARALAMWERETKQNLKLECPTFFPNMTRADYEGYNERKERWRRLLLLRLLSTDPLKRVAREQRAA